MNDKISKHKRRFKIYNVICILFSIMITFGVYMFCYGWAKGDGNDVSFTINTFFILVCLAIGFYICLIWPGYLFHKILKKKDR